MDFALQQRKLRGAAALYMTVGMSAPDSSLRISAAICPVPPMPGAAALIWPGFALASATSSLTDDTGSAVFTTSSSGCG